jgi:ribosomal protein S7
LQDLVDEVGHLFTRQSRLEGDSGVAERLAAELILASKGEGNAIKKNEDTPQRVGG